MAVAYFHRTLSFNVSSYLDVIFTITNATAAAESSSPKRGGPVWLFSAWPWILTTHCTGPRLLSSLVGFSYITSFQYQCHDKYTTTSISMREPDKTSLTDLVRFLKICFWRKCMAATIRSTHWWRYHEEGLRQQRSSCTVEILSITGFQNKVGEPAARREPLHPDHDDFLLIGKSTKSFLIKFFWARQNYLADFFR